MLKRKNWLIFDDLRLWEFLILHPQVFVDVTNAFILYIMLCRYLLQYNKKMQPAY